MLLLVSNGANPNMKDGHGKSPLIRACELGDEKTANILVLDSKISIDCNCQDLMGITPLHWAVAKYVLT